MIENVKYYGHPDTSNYFLAGSFYIARQIKLLQVAVVTLKR